MVGLSGGLARRFKGNFSRSALRGTEGFCLACGSQVSRALFARFTVGGSRAIFAVFRRRRPFIMA